MAMSFKSVRRISCSMFGFPTRNSFSPHSERGCFHFFPHQRNYLIFGQSKLVCNRFKRRTIFPRHFYNAVSWSGLQITHTNGDDIFGKRYIQAGVGSDSPSSGNLTTSNSSDMKSPCWSRSSGWVVNKPVRSRRFEGDELFMDWVLKPRLIIRKAWTRRKTNVPAKTNGKRMLNIGSTLSLGHRDVGWLCQHIDNTRR